MLIKLSSVQFSISRISRIRSDELDGQSKAALTLRAYMRVYARSVNAA